jgi:hypothetical protein
LYGELTKFRSYGAKTGKKLFAYIECYKLKTTPADRTISQTGTKRFKTNLVDKDINDGCISYASTLTGSFSGTRILSLRKLYKYIKNLFEFYPSIKKSVYSKKKRNG